MLPLTVSRSVHKHQGTISQTEAYEEEKTHFIGKKSRDINGALAFANFHCLAA